MQIRANQTSSEWYLAMQTAVMLAMIGRKFLCNALHVRSNGVHEHSYSSMNAKTPKE